MKLSTWNCSLSFQYCIFVCVCVCARECIFLCSFRKGCTRQMRWRLFFVYEREIINFTCTFLFYWRTNIGKQQQQQQQRSTGILSISRHGNFFFFAHVSSFFFLCLFNWTTSHNNDYKQMYKCNKMRKINSGFGAKENDNQHCRCVMCMIILL